MTYRFYYDETEHSRVINEKTIIADNYYDNFITVIVGWDEENEGKIEQRYKEFEEKYADRKSKGELKSTTLAQKQFRYGFASMTRDNLQLVNDFIDIFDEDIYLYFSVQNKLEYIVNQLLDGYRNNIFYDSDLLKYSLIKAIHTYRPESVINCIYNNTDDLAEQIKVFLIDRIEKNESNKALKKRENEAFSQILIILNDIKKPVSIKWDYHMPFEGFSLYLNELGIDKYKLVIDREGDKQKTLKAACDIGHIETTECDSKDAFGIRIADFVAGIIAKFMKSLCDALSSDYSELKKVVLDKKWFDLNEMQHSLYKKLQYVLAGVNNCWYKSYAGVFADDLIVFIALLEYISKMALDDMKDSLNMQGEYLNNYSLQCLERHFVMVQNKLPIEPIAISEGEYFINKWGAKVFVDSKKQPELKIEDGQRECYVMNAGFDRNGIPTITIKEGGKYACYRISEQLNEWVETLLGYAVMGEKIMPSRVLFTKKDGMWYADIL